jgi:tetratricopeptide (TPR) repeat protein
MTITTKNFTATHSSTASCFAIPNLVESRDDEEEEECCGDEVIVVFEQEAASDSSWDSWGEQLMIFAGWDSSRNDDSQSSNPFPGYTSLELAQKLTVVQSNRDSITGNFVKEQKTLLWCLEQGCEEVKPKVWAKSWYFNYLYGEKEGSVVWRDTRNKRLVKERNGKAIEMDADIFDHMIKWKEKANRDFKRGMYNCALEKYIRAEETIGGEVMGLYLVAHQRAELVYVLSNQAECYLRMNKYQQAFIKGTSALRMDSSHAKSVLRRGRAVLYASLDSTNGNSFSVEAVASAVEDLRSVAQSNEKEGSREAETLLDQFEGQTDLRGIA